MSAVSDAFEKLNQSSQKQLDAAHKGKTRVIVQVGHCSLSVGAEGIAEVLRQHIPDNSYLVVAGCDGACYEAPKVMLDYGGRKRAGFTRLDLEDSSSITEQLKGGAITESEYGTAYLAHQRRIALDGCGEIDATDIDDYIAHDGYAGLARALSMPPEDVIDQVDESGLRGRGGAYFPAALKWQGARAINNTPRYLVVNSEEGEPGIFKDRHIMEGVPHRLLEGTVIAAYASDVHQAYIYINAEANLSAERVQQTIEQAYEQGLLGENILGSGFSLNVEIRRGAGGYVCGEETTLLNTMEGYRREPRLRPPFPTEAGLWAKPTVINNAETLASVPFILVNGAKAYAEIGTESDKGTKIISLSGSVMRPGIAEVPMGTTLRQIIYDIGGGPPEGHTITAMAVGGPSSGVFPLSMLDTPIKPGFIHESGVMLGAGGVIALDERVSVLDIVRNLAAYNARESCGKCTPCREGTPRMVELIDRLASGKASLNDLEDMRQLAQLVNAASLCGLGQAAGNPVLSALHFFGDELAMRAGAS